MSLKLAPSDYEIYIPIGEWIEGNIKEWLFEQRPLFKKISAPIDTVLNSLETLFNFIPFLGSIMSIMIPTIFSLVQFLNSSDPLFIFMSLTIVQIIVGNFLEPKLIGKSLNISPLIMLILL